MKRLYVILFAAVLCQSVLSCKEKTTTEKINDRIEEASDSIKNAIETVPVK